MKRRISSFKFGRGAEDLTDGDTFVASIPSGLNTKEKLLAALSAELRFPAYFGMNWDALRDCLRDFSWIEERTIVLLHEDLPALERRDMDIYLDILDDSIEDWQREQRAEHRLIAVFPDAMQAALETNTGARPWYSTEARQ